MHDLEKEHTKTLEAFDTIGAVVQELAGAPSDLQDKLDAAHEQLSRRVDAAHEHLESTILAASRTFRDNHDHIEVRVQSSEHRLTNLENDVAHSKTQNKIPNFGQEPLLARDPLADADPWKQPRPVPPPPLSFSIGSPAEPTIQHRSDSLAPQAPAPQSPTPQPQMGFQSSGGPPPGPMAPHVQSQQPYMYSSPLGAAIHAEPLGTQTETIPIKPFETRDWKIDPKGWDSETRKFNGPPEKCRNWCNIFRDHLTGC